MKLAIFSAQPYDKLYLNDDLAATLNLQCEAVYHSSTLSSETVLLAQGCDAICVFVNDLLDAAVLEALHSYGIHVILLRCAGFNNIDLKTAEYLGFFVANVPAYSPEAVAEFTVAMIQTLNRKTHRAFNRVREGNFRLDGLLGNTLHGKTVGIIGVGRIGLAMARIMNGFGCRLLAHDPYANDEFNEYGTLTELDDLLKQSDIVSLHCPLTDGTRHIINDESLTKLKRGAILVNTSRGGLIDTKAVTVALKSRQLGGLALDVYEDEGSIFYKDHSTNIIHDDVLMRLLTFPNVLVCGHQAFFTEEALHEIAEVTFRNLEDYLMKRSCKNALVRENHLLKGPDVGPVRL
ncbi:putative d-lactate [Phaeomoniella chlamydospora]|uniref:Putative d-lactate n=1 Tax=Phaeomoniella chlamydospora TaxID=158046 RepID=A0A0G2GNH7_PHACM|nr:putative d-lactate [Phaeomoniella chlamydospora]